MPIFWLNIENWLKSDEKLFRSPKSQLRTVPFRLISLDKMVIGMRLGSRKTG